MKLTTRKQRIRFDVKSDLETRHRKQRIRFDVKSDLEARQRLNAVFKGYMVRINKIDYNN